MVDRSSILGFFSYFIILPDPSQKDDQTYESVITMITLFNFETALESAIELGNAYYNATLLEKLEPDVLNEIPIFNATNPVILVNINSTHSFVMAYFNITNIKGNQIFCHFF